MISFCSLASGSSGNAQYIGNKTTKILLDAGLSGKYIQAGLEGIGVDPKDLDGIVITHEHSDHIKGIGVLMRRYGVPIYTTEGTWQGMVDKIGKVDLEKVHIIENNAVFSIKDIEVKAYPVSHDANDPVGYTFQNGSAKVGVITDLGHYTDAILDEIRSCDLVMLEANHDIEMLKMGSYPYYLKRRILSDVGHLSNETSGEIACDIVRNGRARNILLGHLSRENNFPDLAYETVRAIMESEGIRVGDDVMLNMTYRDKIGGLYVIK
ncbi:MAG: MBL fold metallo-hydrolase [Clostridia bacterium]|nr:MBL fold metallo-hydrolase [Clostridia bacterium]